MGKKNNKMNGSKTNQTQREWMYLLVYTPGGSTKESSMQKSSALTERKQG